MIWEYRTPEAAEQFVIGADPAEGNDYSTFILLSKKKNDVVMVGQSKSESPQLGHELNHIGRYYFKHTNLYPTIAVERNMGVATIHVLKDLNYPNIFKMPDSFTSYTQNDSDQYGWHTNTATRPKMLDELALALRQNTIKIPSKPIIDELFSFIRHEKTGKPQAEIGSHDDLVMALAIAWQVCHLTPLETSQTYFDNSRINLGSRSISSSAFRIGR